MGLPMRVDPLRAGDGGPASGFTGSADGDGMRSPRVAGRRLFRPEMLMIGATGRNTGKTELACRIIRQHAASVPLAGLKVTTVVRADGRCPHGGEGCGACSSLAERWCVTRELDADSAKDTSRLLASGAREAYWLRVKPDALGEGAAALLAHVAAGRVTVCESNSLSRVVEPGLFLQVRAAIERSVKPSARVVADLADCVVVSDGTGFDLPLAHLSLVDGQWALRREACVVVIADAPPPASALASLRVQFTQVETADAPTDVDEQRGLLRATVVALSRSASDWCLVARGGRGRIPAGVVNALFRRRAGVRAVVARESSSPSAVQFVLAHRALLPAIVCAVGDPSSSLEALGPCRQWRLVGDRPLGASERS